MNKATADNLGEIDCTENIADFKKRLSKLEKKLGKCEVTGCISGERKERRSFQFKPKCKVT